MVNHLFIPYAKSGYFGDVTHIIFSDRLMNDLLYLSSNACLSNTIYIILFVCPSNSF